MNTHTNKAKENKSQSVASFVAQKESSTSPTLQFKDNRPETVAQRKLQEMAGLYAANKQPIQKKENNTGLPDNLKNGIENLSGHSMDDVKVHYNSDKPAQLNAHAYAQGTDIHLASGQEKHLPHEAWHVVQQKQGRVKPTIQMKGKVNVNDDPGLEKEADVMGSKAIQIKTSNRQIVSNGVTLSKVLQPKWMHDGGQRMVWEPKIPGFTWYYNLEKHKFIYILDHEEGIPAPIVMHQEQLLSREELSELGFGILEDADARIESLETAAEELEGGDEVLAGPSSSTPSELNDSEDSDGSASEQYETPTETQKQIIQYYLTGSEELLKTMLSEEFHVPPETELSLAWGFYEKFIAYCKSQEVNVVYGTIVMNGETVAYDDEGWQVNPLVISDFTKLFYGLIWKLSADTMMEEATAREPIPGVLDAPTKIGGITLYFSRRVLTAKKRLIYSHVALLRNEILHANVEQIAEKMGTEIEAIFTHTLKSWNLSTQKGHSDEDIESGLEDRVIPVEDLIGYLNRAKLSLIHALTSGKLKIIVDSAKTKDSYGAASQSGTHPGHVMGSTVQEVLSGHGPNVIRLNIDATTIKQFKTSLAHEISHIAGFNPTGTPDSGHLESIAEYFENDEKGGLPRIWFDSYFFETLYVRYMKGK